jgi:hypothetical protein
LFGGGSDFFADPSPPPVSDFDAFQSSPVPPAVPPAVVDLFGGPPALQASPQAPVGMQPMMGLMMGQQGGYLQQTSMQPMIGQPMQQASMQQAYEQGGFPPQQGHTVMGQSAMVPQQPFMGMAAQQTASHLAPAQVDISLLF